MFYADWKFELAQNPKLFAVLSQLWGATYAGSNHGGNDDDAGLFKHPHGEFNPQEGYFYLDRVGYRVPEEISQLHSTGSRSKPKPLQRSLTPHLDCCAKDLYGNMQNIEEKLRRWRPIQAFVALTPNHEANTGGFEAVPGFHREFEQHFGGGGSGAGQASEGERRKELADPEIQRICIGEFSPLVPKFDQTVLERFEHIGYGAGSLVCWDWRTPHANAQQNTGRASLPFSPSFHVNERCFRLLPGKTPREVVYTGFLPSVAVNKRFAEGQLASYRQGMLPNHVWHHHKYSDGPQEGLTFQFSELGRKLMSIEPWIL